MVVDDRGRRGCDMKGHFYKVVGVLAAVAMIAGAPAANASLAGENRATDPVKVSSLIVQYKPGVTPMRSDGQIRGTLTLPTTVRKTMSLGSGLGNNMWTIKLSSALTAEAATQICDQMKRSPLIMLAQPDRKMAALG